MTSSTDRDGEYEQLRAATVRLRARVMALVFGMVGGFGLFLATVWLLIRGGENVGEHLGQLYNYFPGYTVTWWGSIVGFGYGTLTGILVGWVFARLYNAAATHRSID